MKSNLIVLLNLGFHIWLSIWNNDGREGFKIM